MNRTKEFGDRAPVRGGNDRRVKDRFDPVAELAPRYWKGGEG
ncbi:MAG: hypothetical protein ACYCUD_13545 [Candidatus Dormibacteria bacterium]